MKSLWICVLAIVMLGTPALAQDTDNQQDREPSVLFVQSGKGLEVTKETIKLVKPSRRTTWVTDRPERVVGRISNHTFATLWDEGDESFADDPPNAIVTVGGRHPVIVLLTDVSVGSDYISYDYELLSGRFPYKSAPTTIVIDYGDGEGFREFFGEQV